MPTPPSVDQLPPPGEVPQYARSFSGSDRSGQGALKVVHEEPLVLGERPLRARQYDGTGTVRQQRDAVSAGGDLGAGRGSWEHGGGEGGGEGQRGEVGGVQRGRVTAERAPAARAFEAGKGCTVTGESAARAGETARVLRGTVAAEAAMAASR